MHSSTGMTVTVLLRYDRDREWNHILLITKLLSFLSYYEYSTCTNLRTQIKATRDRTATSNIDRWTIYPLPFYKKRR